MITDEGKQLFAGPEVDEVAADMSGRVARAPDGSYEAMAVCQGIKIFLTVAGLVLSSEEGERIFTIKTTGRKTAFGTSGGEEYSWDPPKDGILLKLRLSELVIEVYQDVDEAVSRVYWLFRRLNHEGPDEGVLVYMGDIDRNLELRP